MSASKSDAKSSTKNNAIQSTQSSTGPQSPVVSASGEKSIVRYNSGVDLSGSKNAAYTVNTTTFDAQFGTDVVDRAFTWASDLAGKAAEMFTTQQDASAASQAANTALLAGAIGSFSDLGKVQATGGQSDTNKTFLYLGIAAAGLLAVVLWKR